MSAALADTTPHIADSAPLAEPSLHEILRCATGDVHERLHAHRGFAAVKAGTIDRRAYTTLLCRLYGFHRPFEVVARIAPHRTTWLESDLDNLGVDAEKRALLPRCAAFPKKAMREYILGSHYVVEGSALGGRGLARQLDDLLGPGMISGRRFFHGHGSGTGAVWRDYLMKLSAVPDVGTKRAAVIEGAIETFMIFEQWLEKWDNGHE